MVSDLIFLYLDFHKTFQNPSKIEIGNQQSANRVSNYISSGTFDMPMIRRRRTQPPIDASYGLHQQSLGVGYSKQLNIMNQMINRSSEFLRYFLQLTGLAQLLMKAHTLLLTTSCHTATKVIGLMMGIELTSTSHSLHSAGLKIKKGRNIKDFVKNVPHVKQQSTAEFLRITIKSLKIRSIFKQTKSCF